MATWALFFHILASVLIFSGMVVVAVGFEQARQPASERGSAVVSREQNRRPLVSAGIIAVVALGLWVVELRGHGLTEPWIVGALLLLVVATGAGIVGDSGRNELDGSR